MKKAVSLLLIITMMLSLLPVFSLAADNESARLKSDKAYIILAPETFSSTGNWAVTQNSDAGGYVSTYLKGNYSADTGFLRPATRKIVLPDDGTYYIWALSREYTSYVGERFFDIKIGNYPTIRSGNHGKDGWYWQKSDPIPAFSGEYELKMADANSSVARFGMLIVTNDETFEPINTSAAFEIYNKNQYKDGLYSVKEKSKIPDSDRPGSDVAVKLNGKYMTFDVDPTILSGRTMVPFRAIFEALGCTVAWNADSYVATGTRNGMTIRLPIGSKNANVNGKATMLDQPAVISNGRTLVPLRFVSEALGAAVDWNGDTRTVTILASIPEPVYWLRPSTFTELGTWTLTPGTAGAFSETVLLGLTPTGAGATIADAKPENSVPATAKIQVAKEGKYWVWGRVKDFAENQQGTRYCGISVNGNIVDHKFGSHGSTGFKWEKAPVQVTLNKGENEIKLLDTSGFYARFDSFLFCQSDNFVPPEGETAMLAIAGPLSSGSLDISDFPRYANEDAVATDSVTIENESTKVVFYKVPTSRGQVIQNEIYSTDASGNFVKTKTRDEDLGLYITKADTASFKRTQDMATYSTTYTKNGKTYSYNGYNPYDAGNGKWFVPVDFTQNGNSVTLIFEDTDSVKATATWTLEQGNPSPLVTATMTALTDGYYSMGAWEGGEFGEPEFTDAVAPYRVLKKRVHEEICTLVEQYMFTPMGCYTLAENNKYSSAPVTKGIVADPEWIPGRWVHEDDSKFAINMKTPDGNFKGAIFAPILGIEDSHLSANETYTLKYRVISTVSDWFNNYKYVAQELFNVHDYRQNTYYTLNDAIFNTRKLSLDDWYGGWDDAIKSHYNMEAITTGSVANPMQALQDYLLSENEELLTERVIPTLAEFFTRPDLHFNPGLIGYGSTTGWQKAPKEPDTIGTPKNGYNTNVVAGMYEMTGGNVPFLYELGLEKGKGAVANAYGNIPPFVNNLNMYQYTGDKSYLDTAITQADQYLADTVYSNDGIMGKMPGWINFIYHGGYYPNFSSLLDIYEVTKDKKYLDAAEYVAEMILTALWVPGIQGDRKNELIEVNNFETMGYRDASTKDWPQTDKSATPWHGEEIWRVGYDKDTDPYGLLSKAKIQPSMVERWIPERVGLGLEQSSTFENGSCNIIMNYWAGDFMRLAGYTGESMFSDAARNAIIGRFGTYGGYYQTDYITAQQFEKYPYEGPEVTGVYWHHIPPFLAMLEDFLFAQTELWSNGNITFPSLREQGYAYFSSKQFGHKPGKFFNHTEMWPWLAENTIDSGNLQIDWLAARKDGLMGIALMNESNDAVTTTVSLLNGVPGGTAYTGVANVYDKDGNVTNINVNAGKFEITIPGKSLRAVTIAIPEVKAPAFAKNLYTLDGNFELGATVTNHIDGRGYVLQISPENYYAYVYITAVPSTASGLEMTYTVGDKTETVTTNTYPYEFIIKVDDPTKEFKYTLTQLGKDGSRTDMGTCTLMTKALSEAKGIKYTGEVPKTKPSKANVEVKYSGSKAKFEPFSLSYTRHGYDGTDFKFIVKESVLETVGTSEKELVGLPVGGTFSVSGMSKDIISVITGIEPHAEGLVVKVSEVPGVSTATYPTSGSGSHKFDLKVYPYGTDIEAVFVQEEQEKNAVKNVKYKGSKTKFSPVQVEYSRQGHDQKGSFRFIVPQGSVSGVPISEKEMVGLPVYGVLIDGNKTTEFSSIISSLEFRDSDIVLNIPETTKVSTNDYSNSASGSYKFDFKIYPYGTDLSKIEYEVTVKNEVVEQNTSGKYEGSGKKFKPVRIDYSRQGQADLKFRFITPKSSIESTVPATPKELVGLTVTGKVTFNGKVTDFESVITSVEDRGNDIVIVIPETITVTTSEYYDSSKESYTFDIYINPYQK